MTRGTGRTHTVFSSTVLVRAEFKRWSLEHHLGVGQNHEYVWWVESLDVHRRSSELSERDKDSALKCPWWMSHYHKHQEIGQITTMISCERGVGRFS